MTDAVEQSRMMIDDLSHTGELSMLYRCEIADTIRAQAARITDLEFALNAARADLDNPNGPQFKRMREALSALAFHPAHKYTAMGRRARAALASAEGETDG